MLIRESKFAPLVRNHLFLLDMKRKYCLIRNDGDTSPSQFIFVVWVGSSLRETTMLALVEQFCKDCGWYFKRWSSTVDSAIQNRTKLIRADGNKTAPSFSMIQMDIEKCYRTIIDDSWIALEKSFVMSPQETMLRHRFNPLFLLRLHRRYRNTSCSPSKRKYLSHENESVISGFAMPMVAIVVLILVDAFVSHIISSLTF